MSAQRSVVIQFQRVDFPQAPEGPDRETQVAHPSMAGRAACGFNEQADVVDYLLVLGPSG